MLVIERRMMDHHKRMELLRDKDYDRYFRMLELACDEAEAVAGHAMYLAHRHGCVRIEKEGLNIWYYLHKSCKYGNDLQLTPWDDYGPIRDTKVSSPSDVAYLMNGTIRVYAETEEECH